MYSKFARTIDDAPSGHEAVAPDRFVRISAGEIIAGLVDALMQGKACLALTGPAGSGKTMAAAAIRDELVGRSVQVRSVGRGQAKSLRLPDIAAQLLDRPQETLTEDDIFDLFEVMTAREAAESRSVLIIDDAEVLEPSTLEYLRLMATMPMAEGPQFVFVGRPEFWEVTNRPATSQFKELITARWELGRLNADTTRAFIERLVVSQGQSMREVFDAGGLAALIQKSDGLFGRILALLTRARAMQATQRVRRLTSGVIETAAATLDGGETTALDPGGASASSEVHAAAADPMPVPNVALTLVSAPSAPPDPASEPFGGAVVADRPPRRRAYAYAYALGLVLSAAGTVAYWGISAGAYRKTTPATEVDALDSVASPAQSAAGAVAPSQQRTTSAQMDINAAVANQSPPSLSQDTPAAVAPAQPESGQSTANVANRLAAIMPPAGGSIADDASKQSVLHGTGQDPDVAAVATLAAQRPVQADTLPVVPLPAVPTQGRVAASTATLTEPPSPQAPMPPSAAPLPTVPTQGPVAASTATPTEPQVPQADTPPVVPSPAVPTQGPVAASTATPAEPQAPQGAMPPAAPLPAAPTQGQMAAASAATPTEPQAPRVTAAATMPNASRSPQAAMPSPAPVQQQATAERATAEFYAARGDDMLEIRDLSAARRFYETAANAGSGRAAMVLARTYDPAFLSQLRVIGLRPDPVLAATWYRRAAELNVPEAAAQLRALTTDAAR
jgi:type II secretory pathway predicted ATPase ExeA